MKLIRTICIVIAGLACGAGVCAAQAAPTQADLDKAIEQVRKDARTDANTIIGASMQFSSENAAKFWPLYNKYEQQRKAINDERIAVIKDYASNFAQMTDARALELTHRAIAAEEKAEGAKKAFIAELEKALPGKVVARFYQVHSRIDTLVQLTLAAQIPLVQ